MLLVRENVLVADEYLGKGTADHAPFHPREVVKHALELSVWAFYSGAGPPERRQLSRIQF